MKTNIKKSLFALITATMLAFPAITVFAEGEPDNVSNVVATAVDATSIGLTWDAAQDDGGGLVDHYRVYYGTTSIQTVGTGDYDNEIDTPNNNTSYVATGLTPATKYYFSVTAINSADLESEAYSYEANASTMAEEVEETDITSPTVVSVIAVDNMHVRVMFSEAVQLPELLPEAAFSIEEQINPGNTLDIASVTIDITDTDGKTVLLTTSEQKLNVNYIVTAGVGIKDVAGNPIVSGNTDSGLFSGSGIVTEGATTATEAEPEEDLAEAAPGAEAICGNKIVEEDEECDDGNTVSNDGCSDVCVQDEDTTPPEDITNLILSFKADLEKFIIIMNWTASIDSYGDLVEQVLYQSMDRGSTYDTGTALGADSAKHELPDMEGGKEYTFKITTKDDNGNESVGVVKSIRLPQTGVGLGLMLLGSAGLAGRLLRRKKQ